jgi:hypothetical protein
MNYKCLSCHSWFSIYLHGIGGGSLFFRSYKSYIAKFLPSLHNQWCFHVFVSAVKGEKFWHWIMMIWSMMSECLHPLGKQLAGRDITFLRAPRQSE